jgi:hypothetical protein
VSPAAEKIRKVPKNLADEKTAHEQTEVFWLPAIVKCYGSVERFLYYFWLSQEGRAAIEALVKSGDPQMDQLLQENIKKFATCDQGLE